MRAGRPGTSIAAPQHIRADDKVVVGVKGTARTNEWIPPPSARIIRQLGVSRMRAASERMAEEDGVVRCWREAAPGFVRERDGREHLAAVQGERIKGDGGRRLRARNSFRHGGGFVEATLRRLHQTAHKQFPPDAEQTECPHPVRGEGHRDTTLLCRAWYRRAASVTAGTREHTERQGMLTVPTRLGLQRWLCATASVRGSEVIFGGGGGAEFSPATALYSHGPRAYSSSSLPLVPLVIVLTIVTCRPQNKPPSARGSRGRIAFGGMRAGAYLLISRTISPEFAPCPLHCGWVARLLRAVFPQPLLMRVGHHIFNC